MSYIRNRNIVNVLLFDNIMKSVYNCPNIKKETHEEQSNQDWNNCNNCTTYILLWPAAGDGNSGVDCARRGAFSHSATLDGAVVICVFWHNAGGIMVDGWTYMQVQM